MPDDLPPNPQGVDLVAVRRYIKLRAVVLREGSSAAEVTRAREAMARLREANPGVDAAADWTAATLRAQRDRDTGTAHPDPGTTPPDPAPAAPDAPSLPPLVRAWASRWGAAVGSAAAAADHAARSKIAAALPVAAERFVETTLAGLESSLTLETPMPKQTTGALIQSIDIAGASFEDDTGTDAIVLVLAIPGDVFNDLVARSEDSGSGRLYRKLGEAVMGAGLELYEDATVGDWPMVGDFDLRDLVEETDD